jgi:hypothetical protein
LPITIHNSSWVVHDHPSGTSIVFKFVPNVFLTQSDRKKLSTLFIRLTSRSQYVLHSHLLHTGGLRYAVAALPPRRMQSSKASATERTVSSESACTKGCLSEGPSMARVWRKIKHEAAHYWHGSKLLVSEVRISGRLPQWKILHGESLTRRERRQVWCHCHLSRHGLINMLGMFFF